MRRWIRKAGIALAGLFVAVQAVPCARENPPVTLDAGAPGAAAAALRRACYDCHSNETRWPWYSAVAPASWLVARDVRQGRKKMNLSEWDRYDERKRAKLLAKSWKEIGKGEMPLWFYVPLHPDARLSPEDQAALRAWAEAGGPASPGPGAR